MPIDTLEPISGDPEAIAVAARNLQAVAAEVAATSARLRALANHDGSWSGRAAMRARARSITLPPKLAKVRDSYATAGAALHGYAAALREIQVAAGTARGSASRAATDLQYARAARDAAAEQDARATGAALAAGLPVPVPSAVRYESHIADAEARLRRAAAAHQAAREQQRGAARTAAARLHEASREGMHSKPWWRHALASAAHWAQQTWTDSLREIARGALSISAMAGLAALAVAVGGVAFPPLELGAGALESLSMASGAVATMSATVLAATGHASWKGAALDAVAVLPGLGSAATRLVPRRLVTGQQAAVAVRTADTDIGRAQRPGTNQHSSRIELQPTDSWADPSTLPRHFRRHGADFESESHTDYARRAARFFLESQLRRLPTKIDMDGTVRIYEPSSNTFGSYNPLGKTRTFFKPKSSSYWDRQVGVTVEDLMEQ